MSHWTPVNMTEYVIEHYDTLNTKGCTDEAPFGQFNDSHPIKLL